MFRSAGTAEIIRSHQKDDSFMSHLRSSVAEIVQNVAGPRVWIQWRRHLDIGADLAYFVLTTCSDLQTVGEEYVNIIQTDGSLRALPSKWRRLLMVALQVVTPYLLHGTLDKLERELRTSPSIPIHPATRETILGILPVIRKTVTVIHRLHLALFYVKGVFYHLAKRLTGVHYIQYMSRERSISSVRPFQILGYLSLVQLLASFLLHLTYLVMALHRSKRLSQDSPTWSDDFEQDSGKVMSNEKCPLCLGRRRLTTLTPCGHLYCWVCIHEWCQTKGECPLCRDQFPAHRLIPLQNFDAS